MAKKKSASDSEKQLTCFVVIGFGRKTDYATGRVLDLDKTYELLIQPAFDKVNVNAFRAIDANLTGSIDSIMYQWIFEADIVIADLSTLNANVFYELGVRHAQKPNTTIIIAESELMSRLPFDLGHFVVHQYHHDGDQITAAEQKRFVDLLGGILEQILADEKKRLAQKKPPERQTDSPVFTFLDGMEPPEYRSETQLEPPPYVPPEERKKRKPKEGESLASVIDAAEAAKRASNFEEAIRLFGKAIDMDTRPDPSDPARHKGKEKPDVFLAQRLALVTYKHGERKDDDGQIDEKVAIAALHEAEKILEQYCAPPPGTSTDPETLGLSGAINKRLFDHTGKLAYLERAIRFYERGFYVKQDYYNGINVAFMYTLRANRLDSRYDAIVSYGHANMIRRRVGEICDELINDQEGFAKRGDRDWVLMTRAEVHQGLGESEQEELLAPRIEQEWNDFSKSSYLQQKARLAKEIEDFHRRVRPDELDNGAPPQSGEPAPGNSADEATNVAGLVEDESEGAEIEESRPTVRRSPDGDIVIDANIARGRRIRSIDVSCKIEYS